MEKKITNPSMTKLPEILEKLNVNGKYDRIIEKAKKGFYHDFKFDILDPFTTEVCPKVALVRELSRFPELRELVARVKHGDFDDSPDEEDRQRIREEHKDSPGLLRMLGL